MQHPTIPLFTVARREGYPTYSALARELGFSQPSINRVALGKRRVSLRLRNAVKRVFPQYDPDWLLGLTTETGEERAS